MKPEKIADILTRHFGVRIRSTRIDSRPDASEWSRDASHWRVTLTRNGKRMQVTYSMGSAHTGEPKLCDVFNCVQLDAGYAENARDFADFCSDIGMDTDSRKAYRMYKACERTAKSLSRLFNAGELCELRELFSDY